MTRKDFLFLAEALKRARPALPWTGVRRHLYDGWEAAVRGIAYDIAEQTKKFDVHLFLRNAGVVISPVQKGIMNLTTTGERR